MTSRGNEKLFMGHDSIPGNEKSFLGNDKAIDLPTTQGGWVCGWVGAVCMLVGGWMGGCLGLLTVRLVGLYGGSRY